ncbi:hypothetical protein [Mycolicibacterium vaccae]|uniref:hypothetical protein n=1 Tax=Mycolicibacterium vaccae TaxID=1810 RepID=UPI003CF0CB24
MTLAPASATPVVRQERTDTFMTPFLYVDVILNTQNHTVEFKEIVAIANIF